MKKELNLVNVYALATGTTLSAGFFLLPGLAAQQAGPAMILSYLIAAVPLIPAMFCMMELATAMPRAGGLYYFLDRSMGPLIGTIGGLGTWLSLTLKTAFALVGMGAYLNLFIPGDHMILLSICMAIFFGGVNLFGAKHSGTIQVYFVAGLLFLLGGFITSGLFAIQPENFSGFFDAGGESILATAGFVYISYVGVTNVASVSEEVQHPEKNLPLGMFLAFGVALLVYGLGTFVMVGVLPPEELKGNLTPVASAADHMVGHWGKVLVTIAAVLAFSSVANAGILSASRYPLAMSRDHLLPAFFRHLSKRQIPNNGVLLTLLMILIIIIFLNPMKIAKLASGFQLLMFAFCCLAVIIMRESRIEAYDPGFRAPFYPWLQLFGIVTPFFLIIEMGWMTILFSFGLVAIGALWYFYYARKRVSRDGAIFHVFEHLGKQRDISLEPELRSILKEKGLRSKDPFAELIANAQILDLEEEEGFDTIIKKAAHKLAKRVGYLGYTSDVIERDLLRGTKIGATPVSHGFALPHLRLKNITAPELLIVRAKNGVRVDMGEEFWGEHIPDGPIKALFFLISPDDNPGQHLRILAKIAGRVDDENFMNDWLDARNKEELKDLLSGDERFLSLQLRQKTPSGSFIGMKIKDLKLPAGNLIAVIRREGETIVPSGNTQLEENDHLTIIGTEDSIRKFQDLYGNKT